MADRRPRIRIARTPCSVPSRVWRGAGEIGWGAADTPLLAPLEPPEHIDDFMREAGISCRGWSENE